MYSKQLFLLATYLIYQVFAEAEWKLDEEWNAYKMKYGKTYDGAEEEDKRFMIWKKNVEEVELHNANYEEQ